MERWTDLDAEPADLLMGCMWWLMKKAIENDFGF